MRSLTALILLALAGLACAHPEDEFCVPGEGGLDPALCEELNAIQSGSELRPLLDEQGNELGSLATAWLYTGIGVRHILPGGLDHILFVLALFLTSTRLKALALQVTMFTLAHSLTLGMAAAGWISLNSGWVEALIAATIAFVAIENLFVKHLPSWRLPVVFLFGLLHGLGFAGFFGELGLPENQFLAGLVGFNVGVEIGQIGVLLVALALATALRRRFEAKQLPELTYRRFVVLPGSLAIAAIGSFWTFERLLAI
ncbi:MAG: HupE/UreJ family protein [Woeseiaceae bacterium]|nr:HupE/UreJ family protein [Woeseiaceae bacterium]